MGASFQFNLRCRGLKFQGWLRPSCQRVLSSQEELECCVPGRRAVSTTQMAGVRCRSPARTASVVSAPSPEKPRNLKPKRLKPSALNPKPALSSRAKFPPAAYVSVDAWEWRPPGGPEGGCLPVEAMRASGLNIGACMTTNMTP